MVRVRNRGLSLAEAIVATFVFLLITGVCIYFFKSLLTQSPHRIMFQAVSKQADVTLLKLVDTLQSSQPSGVGVTQLGTGSSALSIQKTLKTSSLGSVAWEEALHLFWKNPGEDLLRYAKVDKVEAQKAGLFLSAQHPLRPSPEQLDTLIFSFSKKSKILIPNLESFDVSEGWMLNEEPVGISIKAVNPRMREQRYNVQRAVWVGR